MLNMNKKLTVLMAMTVLLVPACSRPNKEDELSKKLTDTQRQVDKWQKQSVADGKALNDYCVNELKKKMDLNRLGIFGCVDNPPPAPAPAQANTPAPTPNK